MKQKISFNHAELMNKKGSVVAHVDVPKNCKAALFEGHCYVQTDHKGKYKEVDLHIVKPLEVAPKKEEKKEKKSAKKDD